jgi:Kef-type K+ transport system membrane component KefB
MKQIKVELGFFILLFLLPLFFIVVGPFIQIWAVNTLFKTSIEYSGLNWACVMILNSSLNAVSYKGR